MGDVIVLDLETQKSFDDVGGRANLHLLRVSVVGLYSYERDEFRTYTEWETPSLRRVLEEASLVIGFNTKRFDYAVLEPYFKKPLRSIASLDIMEDVERHLGHRLSLETLAQATLGHGKTGDGLDAIRFFRAGELDKLKSYCLADVKLTRDLFEHGRRHGQLKYARNGSVYSLPVNWSGVALPTPTSVAPRS